MKTVVITLPHRTDRQELIREEFDKWGIEFEFYFAQPASSPALSNANAHRAIIAANRDEEWLMICEDDVYFDRNPFSIPLPPGWFQYYLGANITNQTFKGPAGWSILQGAWGAYCIIYSKAGLNYVADFYKVDTWVNHCYDDYCRGWLHLKAKSLIFNEPVALTRAGYSDVEKANGDYRPLILESYKFICK